MKDWRVKYNAWRDSLDPTQFKDRKEIDKAIDNKLEELLDQRDDTIESFVETKDKLNAKIVELEKTIELYENKEY